jgi:hemolysin activation/secretion protein
MKPSLYLAVLLPLALGACGIPDIIAYGVKSAEKAHDEQEKQKAAQQQQQVQPAQPVVVNAPQTPAPEPPPPAATAAPVRESVSTEKLN